MIDTYTKPKISVCKLATVLNKPVKATCVNATALQPQWEKKSYIPLYPRYTTKKEEKRVSSFNIYQKTPVFLEEP